MFYPPFCLSISRKTVKLLANFDEIFGEVQCVTSKN